jgi:hypothetical protein
MATEWYYSKNGSKHGPVAGAELEALAVAGKLLPTDLVWKDGFASWQPAAKVEGLFPATPSFVTWVIVSVVVAAVVLVAIGFGISSAFSSNKPAPDVSDSGNTSGSSSNADVELGNARAEAKAARTAQAKAEAELMKTKAAAEAARIAQAKAEADLLNAKAESEAARIAQAKAEAELEKARSNTPNSPDSTPAKKEELGNAATRLQGLREFAKKSFPGATHVVDGMSRSAFLKKYPSAKEELSESRPAAKYREYWCDFHRYGFLDDRLIFVSHTFPRSQAALDREVSDAEKALGIPTTKAISKQETMDGVTLKYAWILDEAGFTVMYIAIHEDQLGLGLIKSIGNIAGMKRFQGRLGK